MYKFIYTTILISFILNVNFLFADDCLIDDKGKQAVDMSVDIINLKAWIKIDPYKQIVDANVEYEFKPLRIDCDSLIFQTPEIEIKAAFLNNRDLIIKKNLNTTIVYLDRKLIVDSVYYLSFKYQANPSTELFFTGWNDKKNIKRKQIWAHSPGHWIPFINQKHDILKSELIVNFDSKYQVFSNGDRLSVIDNGDGTSTWHYKLDKPHVIYLICLAIGEYKYKTFTTRNGSPVELWYYPDKESKYSTAYKYSELMIDFFDNEIGIKYPWNSYRQAPVADYLFGGMETTTATIFGDYMFINDSAWLQRNYVNVNSHELNHQWFGNYVSHLNNRHTWLTESFATYYAKLFEKSIFGDDYYQLEKTKELQKVFDAAKINNNPIMHSQAGTERWYPKGSLVIGMLRYVMGDDNFRRAIKYYLEKNANQVVETYDLLKAIRESTGLSMDWFFEQWIYRGGEPEFLISNKISKDSISIFVDQKQIIDNVRPVYKMPVDIHIYYKDGTYDSTRVWINDTNNCFSIKLNQGKEFNFFVFDANQNILKKTEYKISTELLLNQAQYAINLIDRYEAIKALKKESLETKRNIYHKIFEKENFHLIKSEIINQLINDKQSFNIIQKALESDCGQLRLNTISTLDQIPSELKKSTEKLLKDKYYNIIELALDKLCKSFPQKADSYLEITENLMGWRGKNIRITWLKKSYLNKNNIKYIKELMDYTSESYDFETRINSLKVLNELKIETGEFNKNLIKAFTYWNFKLRDAAKEIINSKLSNEKFVKFMENIVASDLLKEQEKIKVKNLLNSKK